MNFNDKDLNRLKVKRFLKSKIDLSTEEIQRLIEELESAKENKANMKIAYFIDGVTEYEYSKIKAINIRKGFVKLKNNTKILINDIVEVKKQ